MKIARVVFSRVEQYSDPFLGSNETILTAYWDGRTVVYVIGRIEVVELGDED
jgi:hypothetical protein